MNSYDEPVFETSSLGFYLRVYGDRVEFRDSKGRHTVFMDQITSVSLPFLGGSSIDIETSGGERHNIVAGRKKDAFTAIMQAQGSYRERAGKERPYSVADEIQKLISLRDSGVLTHEEYESQKKRLLF